MNCRNKANSYYIQKSNFGAFIKFCCTELKRGGYNENDNYNKKENCLYYEFYMGFNEELKTVVKLNVKICLSKIRDEEKECEYYPIFLKTNIYNTITSIVRIYDYSSDDEFKKKIKIWIENDFTKGGYSKYKKRIIATFEMIENYDDSKLISLEDRKNIDESLLDSNIKENPFKYYKPDRCYGSRELLYSENDREMKDSFIGLYLLSLIQMINATERYSCSLEDKEKINALFHKVYDLPKQYKAKLYRFQDGEFYINPWNIMYCCELYRDCVPEKDNLQSHHYLITFNSEWNMFEYISDMYNPRPYDVDNIVNLGKYGFI